jgi:hypothetical protein
MTLMLVAAGPTDAQIYKVTEGDSVIFTDRPASPDANRSVEKVDIPTTNRAPSVEPQAQPPAATAESAPAAVAPSVTIASPSNETTIAMGPGNYDVAAITSPALGRSEALQLLIDGQPYGPPQRSGNWRIEGSPRGQHDLEVLRVAGGGDPVARSESVRIYVLRPSIIRR